MNTDIYRRFLKFIKETSVKYGLILISDIRYFIVFFVRKYFEMDDEIETPITDEIVEPSVEPKSEEKGYLARDEYTSERFKLELNNLPKYFGFGVRSNEFFQFLRNKIYFLLRI